MKEQKKSDPESELVVLESAEATPAQPTSVQPVGAQATTPPPPLPPDDDIEEVDFGGAAHDESEMDMTPMVDVTFLLLIFFMVTAAFSMQKALQVPKPKEDQASTQSVQEEQDNESVTVEIDEYGSFLVITMNDEVEAPSKQEVIIQLTEARQPTGGLQPPTKLIVKAHERAKHGRVVMVLDAGAQTHFEQVQLMTMTEEE